MTTDLRTLQESTRNELYELARHHHIEGRSSMSKSELGERIAHAQGVQLVRADVFYGSVDHDGKSFMSRERAPYRDDIDLDDLSSKQWKKYATICGRALAQAHALSDETGDVDYDIEPSIVAAIGPTDLFVDDTVRFAIEAADRVRSDHEHFKADHELGAFRTVDVIYR